MSGSDEWLAGLLEGDGCFTMSRDTRSSGRRIQPVARLLMVDEDVVRRAREVGGVGTICQDRHGFWIWSVYGYAAIGLALRLYPHLGARRRNRIGEIVKAWTSQPPRRSHWREKTHCKHGHPFDEANTYIHEKDGKIRRQCRTCKHGTIKRRRAKAKAST